VTVSIEKPVLKVNISGMEEKNGKKSQAIIEVIDFGPLKITGNFLLKDLQRNKEDAENRAINLIAMNRTRNKR
jgi:hypothetical protein